MYTLDDAKVVDLPLGHGDVLVMSGNVQGEFKHGVAKERANKFGPRINLTLRATLGEGGKDKGEPP